VTVQLFNHQVQRDHRLLVTPRRPWRIIRVRYNPGSIRTNVDYLAQLVAHPVHDDPIPITEPVMWPAQLPQSVPLAHDDPRRASGVLWEDGPDGTLPLAAPTVLVPAGASIELTQPLPTRDPGHFEIHYEEQP
jgi:hypothetical protein